MLDDNHFIPNEIFGLWAYVPLAITFAGIAFHMCIQKLRIMHMQKQMCIVRAMLYKLSVAPPGIKEEYECWRSANMKYIDIGPECGPIYDTSLDMYDMKSKLGPEASAVLLLYFLGLADVSSVSNPIGNCDLRWARIIGCLPHIYALHYEEIIMTEFNITRDKERMVWIMLYLCGPDCILTTRMFLLWRTCNLDYQQFYVNKTYLSTEEPGTAGYHPKIFIPLPRQMTTIPRGLPSLLALDAQYHTDRKCSAHSDWLNTLQKTRRKLWNETNVSIERILSLVGCSQLDGSRLNCNMGSILSPIGEI